MPPAGRGYLEPASQASPGSGDGGGKSTAMRLAGAQAACLIGWAHSAILDLRERGPAGLGPKFNRASLHEVVLTAARAARYSRNRRRSNVNGRAGRPERIRPGNPKTNPKSA